MRTNAHINPGEIDPENADPNPQSRTALAFVRAFGRGARRDDAEAAYKRRWCPWLWRD